MLDTDPQLAAADSAKELSIQKAANVNDEDEKLLIQKPDIYPQLPPIRKMDTNARVAAIESNIDQMGIQDQVEGFEQSEMELPAARKDTVQKIMHEFNSIKSPLADDGKVLITVKEEIEFYDPNDQSKPSDSLKPLSAESYVRPAKRSLDQDALPQ